jgi:hypothetical protein
LLLWRYALYNKNMIQRLLILFLIMYTTFVAGQNLVNNPSFEQYDSCPNPNTNICEISYLNLYGWQTYCRSPDYYNSCSITPFLCSVPWTGIGCVSPGAYGCGTYQLAASGNAFCGLMVVTLGSISEDN